MSQEAINRAVRKNRRSRVLGPDARCSRCGCTELSALVVRTRQKQRVILCYECAQVTGRKATTEKHHVIGQATDPDLVIGVPANEHRALSDRQLDWPEAVRHNPNRDPLLVLAAMCHSLKDQLQHWVDLLELVAAWFVELSKALRAKFGECWWNTLGVGTFYSAAVGGTQ
ncbi:MAG: hypothetical protein ACLQUY_05235 [Ktedonobacterales bacterium]